MFRWTVNLIQTKLRFLMDFLPDTPLINEIIRLNEGGINFSNHTFREIQRRHRQNPEQVNELMKKNWESDIVLRKVGALIQMNCLFLAPGVVKSFNRFEIQIDSEKSVGYCSR